MKEPNIFHFLFFLVSSLILTSCYPDRPKNIPEDEKLQASSSNTNNDTLIDGILWHDDKHGLFIDDRDEIEYDVIKIGDQIWFAENLARIPYVCDPLDDCGIWVSDYWGQDIMDAKIYTTYRKYGCLYNWNHAKILCPSGWHLPTDSEWIKLEKHLGIKEDLTNQGFHGEEIEAGGMLKSISEWESPNISANNKTGFSALPAGNLRTYYGKFYDKGKNATFWTSTSCDLENSWARSLSFNKGGIFKGKWLKNHGFSVRCIKNTTVDRTSQDVDSIFTFEAYNQFNNDIIVFKDGIKKRKLPLITSCISAGYKSGDDRYMNVEGYCNCIIESIAKEYTYEEIEPLFISMSQTEVSVYERGYAFVSFPGMEQLINDCSKSNVLTGSDRNFQIESVEQIEALSNYLKEQYGFTKLITNL